MMKFTYKALLPLICAALSLSCATAYPTNLKPNSVKPYESLVDLGSDDLDLLEMDNNVYRYDTPMKRDENSKKLLTNVIQPLSNSDPRDKEPISIDWDRIPVIKESSEQPKVPGSVPSSAVSVKDENMEKVRAIAHNSREVRLVNGKEVEMKDDIATKMMIAMDNLQKEAQEVWAQVNVKLDQGWTDIKTAIESVIQPLKKSGVGA